MVDATRLIQRQEEKKKKKVTDTGDKKTNVKALLSDTDLNLNKLRDEQLDKALDKGPDLEGKSPNLNNLGKTAGSGLHDKEEKKGQVVKPEFDAPLFDDEEIRELLGNERYMEFIKGWQESVLSYTSRLSPSGLHIQPTDEDFEALFTNQNHLHRLGTELGVDNVDDLMDMVNNQDLLSRDIYKRTMIPILNDIVKAELTDVEKERYTIANYEAWDNERGEAWEAFVKEYPEIFDYKGESYLDAPMMGFEAFMTRGLDGLSEDMRGWTTREKIAWVDQYLGVKM